MAEVHFLPLELWRSSALQQETKTIIAAYERCIATNDYEGLASMRDAIERRIDDLEAFYAAHHDDERSVLFEKQRLRLRTLLIEHDGGAAADDARHTLPATPSTAPTISSHAPGGSGSAGGFAHYASSSLPRATARAPPQREVQKEIREDTRLVLPELLAWFEQAGIDEMPEVRPEYVEAVFHAITRTNPDGKMSVRDLRQWHVTFGKRAIKEDLPIGEIVSAAFVRNTGVAATTRREPVQEKRRAGVVDMIATAAHDGSAAAFGGSGAGGRVMYPWDASESAGGGAAAPAAAETVPGPLTLPNGMLEFQVRLTAEEFAQVTLARRKMEAEAKYKARIAAAQSRAAALKADKFGLASADPGADASLFHAMPYDEKVVYPYRSP